MENGGVLTLEKTKVKLVTFLVEEHMWDAFVKAVERPDKPHWSAEETLRRYIKYVATGEI